MSTNVHISFLTRNGENDTKNEYYAVYIYFTVINCFSFSGVFDFCSELIIIYASNMVSTEVCKCFPRILSVEQEGYNLGLFGLRYFYYELDFIIYYKLWISKSMHSRYTIFVIITVKYV